MNTHTLLIGTSKTQEADEYFCAGQNISRFWGALGRVNSNFIENVPNTSLLNQFGVLITDISAAKVAEEKRDKEIKAISLQKGFEHLENQINENQDIQRIAFIGKQAAKWFFIRFIDRVNLLDKKQTFKDDLFEYGKQKWTVNFGDIEMNCFVLTNTNRQWNPKIWNTFWQEVFE